METSKIKLIDWLCELDLDFNTKRIEQYTLANGMNGYLFEISFVSGPPERDGQIILSYDLLDQRSVNVWPSLNDYSVKKEMRAFLINLLSITDQDVWFTFQDDSSRGPIKLSYEMIDEALPIEPPGEELSQTEVDALYANHPILKEPTGPHKRELGYIHEVTVFHIQLPLSVITPNNGEQVCGDANYICISCPSRGDMWIRL